MRASETGDAGEGGGQCLTRSRAFRKLTQRDYGICTVPCSSFYILPPTVYKYGHRLCRGYRSCVGVWRSELSGSRDYARLPGDIINAVAKGYCGMFDVALWRAQQVEARTAAIAHCG